MNIYTNDPHEFWSERPWPKDDNRRGFIFLARAMVDIGQAMFPEDWLGHEPYLSLTPRPLPALPQIPKIPLPLVVAPRIDQPTEAKAEDAEAEPAGPWWAGGTLLAPPPEAVRTIERDEKAERILKGARDRWDKVMDSTLDALDSGELVSSWRSIYGGPYFDLPDTHWNMEDRQISWRRFVLCRMDPRLEFAFTGPLDGPGFIFLKAATLAKLMGRLNGDTATAASAEVLSGIGGPSDAESPDHAQTRIALAALATCYPEGIPKGRGEIKLATNRMDAKFVELAVMEGLNLRPPKARKWQNLRNKK